MTPTLEVQERLRRYLLGQLVDEAREEIERDLLAHDEVFEELLVIEDEIVDDYLSGELTGSERAAFESHFLSTPERHDQLRFGRAFKKFRSRSRRTATPQQLKNVPVHWTWTRSFFSSPWRMAALALVIIGVALGTWQLLFRQSDVDKGLQALNAAYHDQRPLESRISRLDYAPYVITRGPGDEKIDQNDLALAELTLRQALKNSPTPDVHHAMGRVFLAKKQFDDAIKEFDEVLKGDPKNAQLYSDLGASWLEKGRLDRDAPGKGIEDLGRSLENLNRALELNPDLLEARFNRGLCRQELVLNQQAAEDWGEYLKRDSTSRWADEARRHLRNLDLQKTGKAETGEQPLRDFLAAYEVRDSSTAENLVRQNYTSAGNTIADSIVDSYLASRHNRLTSEADNLLNSLSYLAQLEEQRTGDRFVTDLEHFYARATSEQINGLIEARQYMRDGYQCFISANINEAIKNYEKARQIFLRTGNAGEARLADYRTAHSYVLQPSIEKAASILNPLISVCEKNGYRWLLAQCFYIAGNLELNRGEYSKAIEKNNEALHMSEELHDANSILKNLIQLADKYQSLNNTPRSLEFLQRALEIVRDDRAEPVQVWGVYIAMAFNLNSLHLHLAALEFQKESLSLALEMNRPLVLSRNYEYLGLTFGNLKRFDEATAITTHAFEVGRALSGQAMGKNMMAHAMLQIADLHRQAGNYAKAINAYDQSIELYNQLGFQYYSYAAHKGKLLSYVAQSDDISTRTELQTVLQLFEQNRHRINEESNRNTFFDLEQQVYDLAIEFAYSQHNLSEAFAYSELSRARSLADMIVRAPNVTVQEKDPELALSKVSTSFSFDEFQRQIPEQAQIVQYSVLDDKVIAWVITKTGFNATHSDISIQSLGEKVERFLKSVSSAPAAENDAEVRSQAEALYSILIRPIEPLLDPHKFLCVIPDKTLHYLPFGALVSPTSGKYLIEERTLDLAPSFRIFLASSKSASQRAHLRDERLLSVGDPAFDRTLFPLLPDLPAAKKEAASIVSYYRQSRLMMSAEATEQAVKSEIKKANVIHLAAHYVPNEKSSLLSKLVLAKGVGNQAAGSQNTTGALFAYEVYQMSLPQARLVVLSGCQTGIEQNYRGEGPIGFARPFIAAGVPLAVASLWRVESDSTSELMNDFHRHRKQDGLSTVEALSQAQRDMIQSKESQYRHPYYWAGFITIGGYAEF